VIVDHYSELSEGSRKLIRPELPDFPVNALAITSRLEEELGQVTKSTLKPLRIEGNRLSSFVEAYLVYRGKREQFTDVEFFEACRRLSTIVGAKNVTILLAKLYTEQLIGTKNGLQTNQLPDNIPDLMLFYLNELNRNIVTDKLSDRIIHQDAKIIAWECLKQTYRPMAIFRDAAIAALSGDNLELRLQYLEDRLQLIQSSGPAQDKISFTLDPLAEYLAGLHLITLYKNNEDAWHRFLAQTADTLGVLTSTQEFLLAIRECCSTKGKELMVPDFVIKELDRQVESARAVRQNQNASAV